MTEEESARSIDARLRLYHALLVNLYASKYQRNPSDFDDLMRNMLKGLRQMPPAASAPDDDIEMRLVMQFNLDLFAQAVHQGLADQAD